MSISQQEHNINELPGAANFRRCPSFRFMSEDINDAAVKSTFFAAIDRVAIARHIRYTIHKMICFRIECDRCKNC